MENRACAVRLEKAFIALALYLLLLCMTGCEDAVPAEPASAESGTNSAAKDQTDSEEQMMVNSMLVYVNISELARKSSAVIYGTVTEISPPFYVKGVYGAAAYMDITFTPEQVFRGVERERYTLRTESGITDGLQTGYSDTPEFRQDGKYLLFLYQPHCGGAYFTKDDVYYLNGSAQSVFVPVQDDKLFDVAGDAALQEDDIIFVCSEVIFGGERTQISKLQFIDDLEADIYAVNVILSLQTLTEAMPQLNERYPVDPGRYRRELLDTYAGNLRNGFFSQEEYDRLVMELDIYAGILAPDEYEDYRREHEEQVSSEKERLRQAAKYIDS